MKIILKRNNSEYFNKNPFAPQRVSNTAILGPTGCSKTSLLFNILTLNPVYEKIYIITKQPEEKYDFLIKKFPKEVKIFYQDEYDLGELIDGNKQVCCIFDDLISNTDYIHNGLLDLEKRIVHIFF